MKKVFFVFIYLLVPFECEELHVPFCSKWYFNATNTIGPKVDINGNMTSMLNKPMSIVMHRETDTLYIVDSNNNRILKMNNNSNITERVSFNNRSINGSLLRPEDLVLDRSGAMYISDTGNNRIVKWSFKPEKSETILNVQSPKGLYLLENKSYLYIVESSSYPTVIRFDLKSKTRQKVAGDNSRTVSGLSTLNLYGPIGIYVDKNENIYVAESFAARISRWGPGAGSGTRVAGNTGAVQGSGIAALGTPTSVFVDDQGSMYITDMTQNQTLRWPRGAKSPECLIGCTWVLDANRSVLVRANETIRPYDIAFDSRFNLYALESAQNKVKRFRLYLNLTCAWERCRPPALTLEPHLPVYIRSQKFSLNIMPVIDCYIWLPMYTTCRTRACYPGDLQCNETAKFNNHINSFIEIYTSTMIIPSFGFPIGVYNFTCTVRMIETTLSSSLTTIVEIVRSPVIVSLLPVGKSEITISQNQDYTFDASVTLKTEDESYLDNMRFVYYCRRYPNSNYSKKDIDYDIKHPSNSTCFNRLPKSKSFVYKNNNQSIRSSLTILKNSLELGETYEFYVEMYNSQGLIDRSDTVLVEIGSNHPFDIEITSPFDFLIPDNDYSLFNPSTQLVLQSFCSNCESQQIDITWQIYQGQMNSEEIPQWTPYIFPKDLINVWFYGVNTSFLTVTPDFLLSNKSVGYFRFQVTYSDGIQSSVAAVQLKTNYPPYKPNCLPNATVGMTTNYFLFQPNCLPNPTVGMTTSLFFFECTNGEDIDGIRDYFLHAIVGINQVRMSITYSNESTFSTYLPAGDRKLNYQLRLIIHIRDNLGAWTESNVIEVRVQPDINHVNALLDSSYNDPHVLLQTNDYVMINTFSVLLNQIGSKEQETLMKNGEVKISDYIISDFETERVETSGNKKNNDTVKFLQNQNHRSLVREYLLSQFQSISLPTTIEELILLSSTINQLTETTCEWTRKSITSAANICEQYANIIYSISRETTFEQIILVANALSPCPSNIFTGLSAPLQERGVIFSDELSPENFEIREESDGELRDYEDLDTPICNFTTKNFVQCKELALDENNSTEEILHRNRFYYHHKMLALELTHRIDSITFYLAKSVRRHLNLFQTLSVNYPTLRMLVEQILPDALASKFIDLRTRNASVFLPDNLTYSQSNKIGIRTALLLLPSADGKASVGLSTALTLDIIDDDDQQLQINTSNNSLIEMFIPRDINLYRPSFSKQPMTRAFVPRTGRFRANRQFFIYYFDLINNTQSTPISLHFELKPEQLNTSYSIIYKFAHVPAWNSTHKIIDGSAMFCSQNLVNESDYYRFYLDNEQTAGSTSLYLGIRQVHDDEACLNDLPYVIDDPYAFSYDFSIRTYTSGCYFLDDQNHWNSLGLKVGPKTNLDYTHCYSNHT